MTPRLPNPSRMDALQLATELQGLLTLAHTHKRLGKPKWVHIQFESLALSLRVSGPTNRLELFLAPKELGVSPKDTAAIRAAMGLGVELEESIPLFGNSRATKITALTYAFQTASTARPRPSPSRI